MHAPGWQSRCRHYALHFVHISFIPEPALQVPAAKARALDTVTVAPDDPAAKQTAIDAYAPKKPHMDLKRDAARSLRKLDRETQRAIDELRVEVELQQGDALQNREDGVAAAGA